MKKYSKMISLFLSVSLMATVLAGCGSSTPSAGTSGTPATSAGAMVDAEPEYVIHYSHVQSINTPTHQAMEWLKGWLEEQSNGRVTMEISPAGQLYDDSTEIDAITAGNIDMISTYISKLTTLDTSMQYSIAPFLFDNTEQMLAFYADPTVQETIFGKLNDVGITVLGAFYGGDNYLWATSKDIQKPADFSGMKVRENGGQMVQELYAALNASVVTVSYADLYTSAQTGLVDALSCTVDGVNGIALQEIVKYGLDLQFQQSCYLIQFNTDTFNSYPEDVQELIKEGVALASQKELEICKDMTATLLKDFDAAGCTVTHASDDVIQEFKDIWDPIVKDYMSEDWVNAVDTFKTNYKG